MSEQLGPSDLNHLTDAINRVANSDYAVQVDEIKGNEDYNQLARAVNNLITKTHETLTTKLSAAEALNKSEAKYHRLHDSMMDAFACTDMEGRIIESNPSYQAMVGYTAEELRQLTYFDLTPEKWHEFERTTATEHLLTRGYSDVYEKEYRRKDGTIIPVEIRVFLLRSEDGQPEAMWGIVRDITERKNSEQARRLYDFTLSNSPDAVYWINKDASFAFVNGQACQSLGYTQEELQNLKLWDIDPVFPKEEWDSSWAPRPQSGIGIVECIESVHRRKDGSEFPVEITSRKIMLDDVEYDIAFARDISQRKKAEKALELTQFCLDNASVAYFRATEDGKLVDANKQACKNLNYSKPELLTKYVYDIDMMHSKELWYPFIDNLSENAYCKFESAHQRKDKSTFPVEITSTMLKYDGEKFIIGFVTDISERKQAEDAIHESEYYLRKSQEVAHIGSYHFNITEDYWTCSHEMDRILGISPDVHKTLQTWIDLLHPDDQHIMTQYLTRIMAKKVKFDKAYRIIRQTNKEVRWVHGYGEFEFDDNGAPVKMFGTIQDITERKHAEHEKEKLANQLRQSQKLESVGRLAGGVAHDFNNMLTVILGYAELIEGQLDKNNPICSGIREISRAGCRARDITKQLLAFSRKQMISPKLINANQCIQTSIKSLIHLIGEHIEMNFYPKKGLWSIKFDPSQLDQLLINLSVNARDAMPKGGKLTIETDNVAIDEEYCRQYADFLPGQYILIGVSDSGAGIDKDVLSKIFEPFFTTKDVGEGTGLGLATVYGIIKQNNGFINVYSEPGQGTTFKIYLPRAAEAVNEPNPLKIEEEDSGRESILIVEDNDLVRNMTQKMLELAGYIIIVAKDPKNATEICSEPDIAIDLMISDVVMPQMNGTDLWEKVKTIRPDMKVLFMSGYTSNVIVHHGVLDESVSFIQKPFSRNDLIKSINRALGKEEPA